MARLNQNKIETIKEKTKELLDNKVKKSFGKRWSLSLLPILDDFDRASAEIEKDNDNEIFKGILLIKNKLFDSLKSKGLALIEVNKGDEFSADDHEAVTQIPAPSKKMEGKIIDVIEKGYKLGEKVIRYPKVVIGK